MDNRKTLHKPFVCRQNTIIPIEDLHNTKHPINNTHVSGKRTGSRVVTVKEGVPMYAYARGNRKDDPWNLGEIKEVFEWTPNYTGQGYVKIPNFTGKLSYKLTLYNNDVVTFGQIGDRNVFMAFGNGDLGFYWLGFSDVKVDGVLVNSGFAYELNREYLIEATATSTINRLGGYLGWELEGQVTDIVITDEENPANSRHYESIIYDHTRPTTLDLADTISHQHGELIDFPAGEIWTLKE